MRTDETSLACASGYAPVAAMWRVMEKVLHTEERRENGEELAAADPGE